MTGPRRRAGRTLVWTWRVWMLAYLGSAVAQPVLAGAYLEGDYDAIGWHGTNGSALLSAMVVGTALLALGCLGAFLVGFAWALPKVWRWAKRQYAEAFGLDWPEG